MSLPLNIGSDYQYYSDTNYASNTNCEYYTDDSLTKICLHSILWK